MENKQQPKNPIDSKPTKSSLKERFNDIQVHNIFFKEFRIFYASKGLFITLSVIALLTFILPMSISLGVGFNEEGSAIFRSILAKTIPPMFLFLGIFAGQTIIEDLKTGSLSQTIVSPVKRWEIGLGKLMANSLIPFIFITLYVSSCAIGQIGYSVSDSMLLISGTTLAGIYITAIGMIIAIFIPNEKTYQIISSLVIVLFMFLHAYSLPLLWNGKVDALDIFVLINPATPFYSLFGEASSITTAPTGLTWITPELFSGTIHLDVTTSMILISLNLLMYVSIFIYAINNLNKLKNWS